MKFCILYKVWFISLSGFLKPLWYHVSREHVSGRELPLHHCKAGCLWVDRFPSGCSILSCRSSPSWPHAASLTGVLWKVWSSHLPTFFPIVVVLGPLCLPIDLELFVKFLHRNCLWDSRGDSVDPEICIGESHLGTKRRHCTPLRVCSAAWQLLVFQRTWACLTFVHRTFSSLAFLFLMLL
jgi:hypothetical protein